MIYTTLTNRAMRLAYDAHSGQVDKCGLPYVFHPYHLAEQMPDEATTCVALLHDVVEDTAITLDDLACEFPPEVLRALRLLTHDPGVPYLDYVRALAADPVARTVKRADLEHNMDETRYAGCEPPDDRELAQRRERYEASLAILDNAGVEEFGRVLQKRSSAAEHVLYEADPMGLCAGEDGAPRDEYSFEALILAACVTPETPAPEVARIVGLVLGATFDVELDRDGCMPIARRLLEVWPSDEGRLEDDPEAVIAVATEPYRKMQGQWERDSPSVRLPDGGEVQCGATVHALARLRSLGLGLQ